MSKTTISIWLSALAAYLLFLGWHENWRGALTADEIAAFTARIERNENLDQNQRAALIAFMENDTGKEFVMVNLAAYHKGSVTHPETGADVSPNALLDNYFRPFMGRLFARAGYPAFTGQAKGNYLEAWTVGADPGWSGSGLIRYRSRRDMFLAATDPEFGDIHVYKQAALAATLAVPIESSVGFYVSPRVWVALLLGLIAALAHIFTLTFRRST